MKTGRTKGYTSEVRMHAGGGRSFYSWTVLDPVGNRVKFGNTPSRAEAVLEAEKGQMAASASQACEEAIGKLMIDCFGVLPGKLMWVLLPPVLILMFGSAVAWTIQGFRT
jgi:hypothetical protein